MALPSYWCFWWCLRLETSGAQTYCGGGKCSGSLILMNAFGHFDCANAFEIVDIDDIRIIINMIMMIYVHVLIDK